MEEIQSRLKRLEAELSALRDSIRTRKVEIMGKSGKVRISLETDSTGEAILKFFDEKGVARAALSVDANGPALTLFDKKGNTSANLSADADVGPGLCLYGNEGEDGNPCAALQVLPDVGLSLSLFDVNGNTRATIQVTDEDSYLQLADKKGRVIWQAPPE